MPIHSRKNLYPGVNAHLQSFLQSQPGIWRNFHFEYISQLHGVIEAAIPNGYVVLAESSLQKRNDADNEEYMAGLIIYRVDEEDPSHGQPLVHVELIIPVGEDRRAEYLAKRQFVLQNGIRLVEVDFLHEYPPFIAEIPDYSAHTSEAQPYTITVTHLDESVEQDDWYVYSFGVGEPVPTVTLSLNDEADLDIDFNTAYHALFENMRFWSNMVDYASEPANIERYREDDRDYIRALMAEILEEPGEE